MTSDGQQNRVPWIGRSRAFQAVGETIDQCARSEATVLLVGESGTGKGLAARRLHEASRPGEPFVVVHLAALSSTLIEGSLFGHEKGAFTDASRARPGFFRQAGRGTLVLDDVDLLPLDVQPKLLRVLQERVVEPLGSATPVPVEARIVATTNRDLRDEIDAGAFRQDLYYRLAVLEVELPPLRARVEDLEPLAKHLAGQISARLSIPERPFTPEALERLAAHPWPGNVRELENAIERVSVLGSGPGSGPAAGSGEEPPAIAVEELAFLEEPLRGIRRELATRALANGLTVDELSHAMLQEALRENRGNVSAAARQVGLTRRAFDYRMAHGADTET